MHDLFQKETVDFAILKQDFGRYLFNHTTAYELNDSILSELLNESFFQNQDDAWMLKLYEYLYENIHDFYSYNLGDWTYYNVYFLRTENGLHKTIKNKSNEFNVYLPSENDYIGIDKTIKKSLLNEQTSSFFDKLGLKEPDILMWLTESVLYKYKTDSVSVEDEENVEDLNKIFSVWKSCKNESQGYSSYYKFLESVKKLPLLISKNHVGATYFVCPCNVYLSSTYTESNNLEIYFSNYPSVYFLTDLYASFPVEFLKSIGCMSSIRPINNFEYKIDMHGWHKRGIDGFNPNFSFEGLQNALSKVNFQIALIIWDLILQYSKMLKGKIKSTSNLSNGWTHSSSDSDIGKMLSEISWLPTSDGYFKKPSEIFLSDLPEEFDKECAEALFFEKHFMKIKEKSLEDKIQESNLSNADKSKIQKYAELEKKYGVTIDEVESVFKDLSERNYRELLAEKMSSATSEPNSTTDYTPSQNSSDTDENIKDEIDESISDNAEKRKNYDNRSVSKATKVDPETRDKLIAMYRGKCQICSTKIIAKNEHYVMAMHRYVTPKDSSKGISDESNVLALCPNCGAKIKHCAVGFSVHNPTTPNFGAAIKKSRDNRDFICLPIMINGINTEIWYLEAHFKKFKYLYENY